MTVMDVLSKAVEADDAAGAALIDAVVYDFMADLVAVNKQAISEVYALWALDRVQTAKKTLAKSYVDTVAKGAYPADDVHQAAEWLAGIERFIAAAARGEVSKAGANEWWEIGNKRVQRQVARDAQGRFTRGVNQNAKRAVSPADKERLAPQLRAFTDKDKVAWTGGMTAESAASFQGQYEEATAFANELKSALGSNGSKADVVFMVQAPDGRIRNERASLKDVSDKGVKMSGLRADDKILGVEVAPAMGASAQDAARIAEFNLLGGAGGSALAQLANQDPKLRTQLAESLKMPKASEDKSNLSRLFGVLASGGAVLSGVGGAEKVGQMAALVGTMGPQAEEVLGPYVKRTAYRYRGTETTPDPSLRDPQAVLDSRQVDALKQTFPMASSQSLEMHARADAASAILAETIPQDPIIARLSEASGQVLPSQGVMYDQNGKLVSQSVGFTDDHYLPFDLSNLGRLRGGQYVRTRQQGGLTGEDIYTAVMSGARQVQVVSGSGVFTLEMAPDFRGARAMSDKARGMYDRYLKILDAVDGSGLYLEDISPKEKQQIFADARAQLGEAAEDADVKALAEANVDRARRSAQNITPEDEFLAASDALREAGGVMREGEEPMDAASRLRSRERRVFDDAYEERLNEIRSSKTNKLRLNGEGYAIALKTLQEQFPYFIADVKYRELNKLPTDKQQNLPKTRRYAQDQGYAQPGALRAQGVRTGFYRPGDVEPKPKDQYGRPVTAASQAQDTKQDTPEVQETAETPAQQPQVNRAADVGVNSKLSQSDTSIGKIAEQISTGIAEATSTLPLTGKAAARSVTELPFEGLTDDVSRAKWMLAQTRGAAVLDAMNGPAAAMAAESLSKKDAVRAAMLQILQNDGGEDWFDDGNRFAGKATLDEAADWIVEQGRALGEATAMKQGLAQAPAKVDDQINYRGLMPMQLPGIALIGSKDDFRKFAEDPGNETVYTLARAMAFDSDNKQRSIPDMSRVAGDKLDAIKAIGEAKDKWLSMVRAKPGQEPPKPSAVLTDKEWQAAMGQPLPSDAAALSNFDARIESMQLQQAWSLAVTGRVLDAMDGGDVWGPKAGSRLLEPIGKAAKKRRPLKKVTGAPLLLQ
jgi:hypothetical protein